MSGRGQDAADAAARARAELARGGVKRRLLEPGHASFTPGLGGMWLRRPMVLTALALLAGDMIGLSGAIPLIVWQVGAAAAALVAVVLALAGRRRVWLLLTCVMMIGGLLGGSLATVPATPPEGEQLLTGRVREVCSVEEDRVVLHLDRVTTMDGEYRGMLRLTLYRGSKWDDAPAVPVPEALTVGAQVTLYADVYLPQGQRGEGGFDYRAYLMRRGVYSCASGDLAAAQVEGGSTLPVSAWLYGLRRSVSDRLDALLGEHAPVARGIMLGDKAAMPDEEYDMFRDAGFGHILAVSGMHVSFVVMLLGALLVWMPGKLRALVMTLAVALYCGVCGFTPSVVRAAVMSAIALWTRQSGRRYDGPSSMALAAVVILVSSPGAALDTGFALTFAAVLAIYALWSGLQERLPHMIRNARKVKGVRGLMARILGVVVDCAGMSLCVTIGLLPLTSAYFGQVNVASLFTSVVGIYAGMGVLALGWISTLLAGWAQPLAELIAVPAGWCAQAITGTAQWTAGLEWGMLYMRAIDPLWLLAIVPLLLFASRYRPLRGVGRAACALAAAGLVAVLLLPPQTGEGMDYVLLDVGQGDAQLLTDGASAVVIDVGTEDSPLPDYLRRRGLRVKALILTHLHDDHAGALPETVHTTGVKRIYLPPDAQTHADESVLIQLGEVQALGVEIEYLSAGDVLEPIDGLRLTVLHPTEGAPVDDDNDCSLVLRAEYAGRSVLMTGDLTTAGEDFDPGVCDVLKVAHHGSASSSSMEFLAQVNPGLALISASAHNSYGLPSDELLARLDYLGIDALGTYDCGDITVHISPEGDMKASAYLGLPEAA